MPNMRRILLTTSSQRDLHEFVTVIESKTNSQIISQTAESFEKLTARVLEAECDLILVNENEHRKLDTSAINTLLLSTAIPIILLLRNPTVNHAVDMMKAGVSGVADWQDLDRIVELINRNLTDQSIATSEPIYQNIVDHQTDLICRYDSDLRLLFVNRAYCEWQGLPREKLLATTITDRIPASDREQAIAHVKALSINNPVAVSIHDAVLPDGAIQTIEWTDRAIFNENGDIQEYQGVGRDVSERERVTEALRESEEKYRTLVESAESVIVIVDEAGELHFANKPTGKLMNMEVDDIVGKSMYELFPPDVADYQLKLVGEVIDTGKGTVYESAMPMADGQHWFRNSLQPLIDVSGVVNKVFVNSIDITRLKKIETTLLQSEEKFRNIYEQSPLAIQIYDSEGNLTDINQQTLNLYGLDDKKHIIGFNFWSSSFLTEDHKSALKNDQVVTVSSFLDFENVKATNLFPTDKIGIMYFDIYVIPLVLEGKTVGYLAQMVDITERNQAQMALEEANEQLEQRVHERTIELQQSKDRIEAIFNHSADGILLLDSELKIQQGNYAFEKMFAIQADTYFNKSLGELVSVEDRIKIEALLEDIVERHETKQLEIQITRADETKSDAELSIAPINRSNSTVENIVCIIRDVTKRKQGEAERQRYLAEIEDLYNNAPSGYHSMNSEGVFIRINDTELEWLGYTREEFIGKMTFLDIQSPVFYEKSRQMFLKLKQDGFVSGYELELLRKDRSTFWVIVNASSVYDADGNFSHSRSTVHDISELKAAEAQLRYLASLQEFMHDSVIGFDMEGRIQSWNQVSESLFGWTADEVLGNKVFELLNYEYIDTTREDTAQEVIKSGFWTGEINARHRDGYSIHLLASISVNRDTNGEIIGFVGVNHDITERKQYERQLQYHASLQQNVSDAVIVTDMNFTIQSWNKAAERIYGWTEDEVIGVATAEILRTEFSSDEHDYSVQQLQEQGWWQSEVIQHHKDGTLLNILSSITLIKDENGIPQSIIAVNRDITERKRAEVALRESEERYHRIVTIAEESIILTNADAVITYVNPTWIRLTGYSEDETLGREYFDFLNLENMEAARQRFREMKEGQKLRLDRQIIRKDGSSFWVMGFASPIISPTGEFQGILVMITDIDTRKKVEIELAKSLETEREMQEYLTALHDISLKLAQTETLDDFYRVTVSEGLSQLGFERMGFLLYDESDGSAVGTYGTDADGNVVAEHHLRLRPDSLTGILHQTLERSDRFAFIKDTQLFANFEPMGIGENAVAALWHDQVLGWLAIDNGINYEPISQIQLEILAQYALTVGSQLANKRAQQALKTSEEKYRIIANNINDLIIRVNLQSDIVYASPSSYKLLGYDPDEMIELNELDLVHPDDVERVRKIMNQALEVGPVGLRLEERLRHKNGSYLWVEVTAQAVYEHTDQKSLELILSIRDISERKAADLEIRAVTERLKLATSVGQIGVWYYDAISKGFFWDKQMFEIYGVDSSEVTPSFTFWKTTLHPDDYEQAVVGARNPFEEDGFYQAEYRILTPEGITRHLRVRAMRELDEQGQHLRTIGVSIDITDVKEAEIALRESETRFRQLINAAPIATVVTDQNGHIRIVNEQAETLFGFERSELIGQAIEILIPDSLRIQHTQHRNSYMQDPHLREMGVGIELFAKRKDGSLFATEIQLSYVDTPDGIMVMSYVIDITDRKRIEAELERQRVFLRAVIDASPSMIFVKDIDGRFVFGNPAMARLFDTSTEALLTMSDENLNIPQHEVDEFHDADQRVITKGETISLEEGLTLKTGETRWLQTTKVPLVSEDGQSTHVLGISVDITERKRAEITLQQALTKEQELNKLKSSFVATASHQFRTPLAAILATTETLTDFRDRLTEEQIDTRLDRIKSQVNRMKGLMEDVLELSRMQSNQVQYKPEQKDLDALCREIIEDFVHQEVYRNRIVYEGAETPLVTTYDPHLMYHIINNVIHNALKYSESPVYVDLTRVDHEIVLKVVDHGIGIPEDDLKTLFTPFFRAENVGSIAGTGLGLSIVKQSVEAHGGIIDVKSVMGLGTTFTVTIPYHGDSGG